MVTLLWSLTLLSCTSSTCTGCNQMSDRNFLVRPDRVTSSWTLTQSPILKTVALHDLSCRIALFAATLATFFWPLHMSSLIDLLKVSLGVHRFHRLRSIDMRSSRAYSSSAGTRFTLRHAEPVEPLSCLLQCLLAAWGISRKDTLVVSVVFSFLAHLLIQNYVVFSFFQ